MAKGIVVIDTEICKGCELCIEVCPVEILKIEKIAINKSGYLPAFVTDGYKCTACANCAIMCPDSAISIYRLEDGEKRI